MLTCLAWESLLGVWCVLLAPDRERRVSRGIIAPMVLGAENLPDPLAARARPLLFVGNHTRFGLYDLPFLVCELYLRGFKVHLNLNLHLNQNQHLSQILHLKPWCC